MVNRYSPTDFNVKVEQVYQPFNKTVRMSCTFGKEV